MQVDINKFLPLKADSEVQRVEGAFHLLKWRIMKPQKSVAGGSHPAFGALELLSARLDNEKPVYVVQFTLVFPASRIIE